MRYIQCLRLSMLAGLLCFVKVASAQNLIAIDSLQRLLPNSSLACQREIYHLLAIEWADWDNLKALTFTKKEYAVACEMKDSLSIEKSLRIMGQILSRLERFDSAMHVLSQAALAAKRYNFEGELISIYNSIGRINLLIGRYDACLEYYDKCLGLPGIENDFPVQKAILVNKGLLYYKLHDWDKAIEYYNEALILMRKEHLSAGVDLVLINIGLVYIYKRDFERGRYYVDLGMKTCDENCSQLLRMQELFAYGLINFNLGKFGSAEAEFKESMLIAKKVNDFRMWLDNIEKLSDLYLKQKDLVKAAHVLAVADSILPLVSLNQEKRHIYVQRAKFYKATNDPRRQAFYQEKYIELNDSLFAQRLAVNLMRVEGDFHKRLATAEAKNNEDVISLKDSLISSQRLVIGLTVLTILLLIALLLFAIRQNKSRMNANQILEEKVKERTEGFAASLSKVNQRLHVHEEMMRKTVQETGHAMSAIERLCSMGIDDAENMDAYFTDIKKVSIKVLRQVEGLERRTHDEHFV